MKDDALGGAPNVPPSKLPLPVRALAFRFRTSPALPTVAVLEVDTETNPVRIGFDKGQLERLARDAARTAAKVL